MTWSASFLYSQAPLPEGAAPPNPLRDPQALLLSAVYTLVLLLILGAHEMGHYWTCRKNGLSATLPFFIPAPTLIGTMGAFIRIRTPITAKRTLFDVGAGGPLAGIVVAVPVLAIGLALSKVVPALPRDQSLLFGEPLLVKLFGAILYAAIGARARIVGWFFLALFVVMGVFFWAGWLLWAVLVLILGVKHPPVWDEGVPLGKKRTILAFLVLFIFVVSFIPAPIQGFDLISLIKQF